MSNTMGHCAPETADVILAADALPEHSLNVMLSVFSGMAGKSDGYTPVEREVFHSIARLLARLRDLQNEAARRSRRLERKMNLTATGRNANEALNAEFDALVASIS